jgi:hypothetical protein
VGQECVAKKKSRFAGGCDWCRWRISRQSRSRVGRVLLGGNSPAFRFARRMTPWNQYSNSSTGRHIAKNTFQNPRLTHPPFARYNKVEFEAEPIDPKGRKRYTIIFLWPLRLSRFGTMIPDKNKGGHMVGTSTSEGVGGGVLVRKPRHKRGVIAMADTDRLKTEIDTYCREKERLVGESAGKYVLIHAQNVVGTWDSYEDALKEGYRQFGLEPFLIKHIEAIDRVHFFTRDIALCQS